MTSARDVVPDERCVAIVPSLSCVETLSVRKQQSGVELESSALEIY